MYGTLKDELRAELAQIEADGLYKAERVIESSQGARIRVGGREVINFCANNYLGLAGDPRIADAAASTMARWGFGYASVRFICGTSVIHRDLERELSSFLGTEDTILYAAAFDANGGVFEPLFGPEDAIISDELNHASIIDGVRLTKARRERYRHADMDDLRRALERTGDARRRVIATDSVFSMDGDIAPLDTIVELAREYGALVMIDECHATGYLGPGGRGIAAHYGVTDEVDIVTTTFGKALGGASGGCVSGRAEIVEVLRQRSRPYLFSNTLAPAVVGGTREAIRLLAAEPWRTTAPQDRAVRFRSGMVAAGFDLLPSSTAIQAVMLYDEATSVAMAARLLDRGVYVIGFAFPVVPRGRARIRVQFSAAHSDDDVDAAVGAFVAVGREMGVIS